MKIIIIYVVIIAAVVGLGFVLFQSSNNPAAQNSNIGEPIESQGEEHLTEGSTEHAPYNSNPPTSGPHWPQPGRCLAYDAPQQDERMIHNLEHGGIWITYKPDIDPQVKTQLNDFVRRYANVLVSPRPANDSPIALAAWTRLLKLESYDESKIIDFINAYMDRGPEKVSCAR